MKTTPLKVGDEILVRCRVVEVRDQANWAVRVALNGETDEAVDHQGNIRNEAIVAVIADSVFELVE